VSNVIGGYPFIRDEVRTRVLAAIEELGYQPNRAAQSLRTGRSGVIALAVPELDVSYFAEITRLVVEATELEGLTVLIIQTLGELERERAALNGFGRQLIDGLIYSPISGTAEDIRSRASGVPVVLLGEQVSITPNHSGIDHVGIDNVSAAKTATEHLLNLPRRRVAFIGAEHQSHMADMRLTGYRQALRQARIRFDSDLVVGVRGYHRRDGADAVRRILDRPGPLPDALLCANDLLAQGAMRALHDQGLRIPDDVAVAGFDDTDEASYSIPSLTSISPDKRHIARVAVSRLVSRMNGSDGADLDTVAGFSLEIRESTVGRREAGATQPE
jgi:DNA-binding LacI/PurR family transcriptional regulator